MYSFGSDAYLNMPSVGCLARGIVHRVGMNSFFFFFILRRMGKNIALAHHTSTYFHTRRMSI